MLYLLLLIAVAFSAYTAFGVFRLIQVVEEMCDRLEFALTPKGVYKQPPNSDGAETRLKPDELRIRGL